VKEAKCVLNVGGGVPDLKYGLEGPSAEKSHPRISCCLLVLVLVTTSMVGSGDVESTGFPPRLPQTSSAIHNIGFPLVWGCPVTCSRQGGIRCQHPVQTRVRDEGVGGHQAYKTHESVQLGVGVLRAGVVHER
jgi:hypothetical protein